MGDVILDVALTLGCAVGAGLTYDQAIAGGNMASWALALLLTLFSVLSLMHGLEMAHSLGRARERERWHHER